MNIEAKNDAVDWLVQFIRFPTISGNGPIDGSYDNCSQWLMDKCKSIGLESFILPESFPHKPIVVAKWEGSQPELPVIILNSHYDVVPVITEYWTVPAFDGLIKDGRIYGRGTQDMKSVCIQYLVAIKQLIQTGYHPIRTIVLTYVPDEEIGGYDGMNILLSSSYFQSLSIALALDEGLANEDNIYSIFYGERLPWWIKVTAEGNTGHGSRFIDGTAIEQIIQVTQKALDFRATQKSLLHNSDDNDDIIITTDDPIVANSTSITTTTTSTSNTEANSHTNEISPVISIPPSPVVSSKTRHLHENCSHSVALKKRRTLGDVTSLNITQLHAGISAGGQDVVNLVPSTAVAKLDIRISPHISPKLIINELDMWCQEVTKKTRGLPKHGGVTWKFIGNPLKQHQITTINTSNTDDQQMNDTIIEINNIKTNGNTDVTSSFTTTTTTSNNTTDEKKEKEESLDMLKENIAWYNLIQNTLLNDFNIHIQPEIFPAATDSRFLRALGVRAFGFSPIRNSPILLHEHDEYIDKDVYIEGCEVYIVLLQKLSSFISL